MHEGYNRNRQRWRRKEKKMTIQVRINDTTWQLPSPFTLCSTSSYNFNLKDDKWKWTPAGHNLHEKGTELKISLYASNLVLKMWRLKSIPWHQQAYIIVVIHWKLKLEDRPLCQPFMVHSGFIDWWNFSINFRDMLDKAETEYWTTVGNGVRDTENICIIKTDAAQPLTAG